MGEFLGGLASVVIMLAAFCVFIKLFLDFGVFKEEGVYKKFLSTTALVFAAGFIYLLMIAYMYNCTYGATNLFNFHTIFGYEQLPGYLFLSQLVGKLLFGKTILVGFCFSFVYTGIAFWFLSKTLSLFMQEETVFNCICLLLMLPGAIYLFLPNGTAFLFMLLCILLYMVCRKNGSDERNGLAWLNQPKVYYPLLFVILILNLLYLYKFFIVGGPH